MALAKFSGQIVEMAGKLGGQYHSQDKSGNHIQAMPRKISRSPTLSQQKRRRAFRQCHNYIRKHTTAEFVSTWEQYAKPLTWVQAFMSINIIRLFNGLEIDPIPPS